MSNSNAQPRAAKKRDYRMGARADRQAETRQRIVEAAVELHTTLGPAHTSVSQIAELAGVQRHTYYAHFPDEKSLALACSALALERDPLPDVARWQALKPGRRRLRAGLSQIYGWYNRNEGQARCVLRDAEHHALTQEIVALRYGPTFAAANRLLGEGLNPRARALLAVALDFHCWRALSATHGPESAAALMADAIMGMPEDGSDAADAVPGR